MHSIDEALFRHYDRSIPRYTSYPTALEFSDQFPIEAYHERLKAYDVADSLALYVHIPFCERRCSFCACNAIGAPKHNVTPRYLDALTREAELVLRSTEQAQLPVLQYHFGGGTPTYCSPKELSEIHSVLSQKFSILPNAECAIEIDPTVTTIEHIDMLSELGFNRLSMGVQDFSPLVQKAIQRKQKESVTRHLYDYCREKGFHSINLDLVYGLPNQTWEGFEKTLTTIISMRPDRVAVYSYAHVPWGRGNQKQICEELLPTGKAKLSLFMNAMKKFSEAGYFQLGMDHFALPSDELYVSYQKGRLHRNFMGYTSLKTDHVVGLGVSSIGQLAGVYVQNTKKLSNYYKAIDSQEFPISKGYILSSDDNIRAKVIQDLMCRGRVWFEDFRRDFQIGFSEYFDKELELIRETVQQDGLIECFEDSLKVTQTGRLFIRNISHIFDVYSKLKNADKAPFSRAV